VIKLNELNTNNKIVACNTRVGVPHGLKKLILDFSQTFRLLKESQFLQFSTWLVSLSILYNTISAIVLDPEKNRVKFFLDHGYFARV
jgi:hypothetical protein